MPATVIHASLILTPEEEISDGVIVVEDSRIAALGHRDEVRVPANAIDYVAAGMTVIVKAFVVPILLEELVDRIDIRHEIEPIINVPVSIVIAGVLTLVAYTVGASFYHPEAGPSSLGHNTLSVAISVFLIGFFMMLNRRNALSQVLALLTLENGVFLAAICLTYGMPLIVEIGVFFDVLVAAMVLGILVYRIRETFASMDVSKLRRLRG